MKKITFTYNVIAIISSIFLISCESEERKKQNEIEEIRGVVNQYARASNEDSLKKIHKIYRESKDENLRFINEISFNAYSKKNYLDTKVGMYDSIIYNVNFEKLHPLNKFYTYYFLSYSNHLSMDPEKAFNYNKKANSYIENEISLYYPEKQKLQYLLMLISAKVYNNVNELIDNHKENLKKLLDTDEIFDKTKYAYNIAFRSIETEQYDQAIYYAKMAQNTIPDKTKNPLLVETMAVETNGYSKQGKLDSVEYVARNVQKLYENKTIPESELYKYKVYFVESILNFYSKDTVNKMFNDILTYYNNDCNNRYLLTITYKNLADYYQKYNDIEKEKAALRNGLYYTQKCDLTNDFFITEEEKFIDRLLTINIKNNSTDNVKLWFERKKEIHNLRKDQSKLFIKLTQYFSQQEVNYVNKDLEYQKSKVSNSKRINLLYSVLVLVFIFACAYIAFLYFKNVKYQQKLSKGSEKLKEQNNTITLQNQKMKKLVNALQESNENLQNFARVAAHDIKSPISSINSAINYISQKYQSNIDTEDKEIFQYLNQSTTNLSNMINVLLEYSSSNKNIVKNQDVNVRDSINRVIQNLKPEIESSGTIIEISNNTPHVEANESLIEQLFLNIISNAIKFKKENKTLKISIDFEITDDDKVLFIVSDNGIGIDQAYTNEIFKVFKKVHPNNQFEGSGIGLAICKKIIEEFNGTIWVESEKGVGSHFFFTLPLYTKKITAESEP